MQTYTGSEMVTVDVSGTQQVTFASNNDQSVHQLAVTAQVSDDGVPWLSSDSGSLVIVGPGIFAIDASQMTTTCAADSNYLRYVKLSYRLGSTVLGSKDVWFEGNGLTLQQNIPLYNSNITKMGDASNVLVVRNSQTFCAGVAMGAATSNNLSATFTFSGTLKVYKF